MSSSDRRPYETALVLDQEFLDFCQDNLDQKLQTITEIDSIQEDQERLECTISSPAGPGVISIANHKMVEGDPVIFESTGYIPTPLFSNTIYYARVIDHNSFNVSATPTSGLLTTTGGQTGVHTVSYGLGIIRISDRNIFVGPRFYEARTKLPLVVRTLGEWLRPAIEFSSIQIILNNVDGKYNSILPGGANYGGFINKLINIKLGIRNAASTYFNLFQGFVSDSGGFKRDISKIKFVARNKFEDINKNFPPNKLLLAEYPKIDKGTLHKTIPIIYGDYLNDVESEGNIPVIIVNKKDPELYYEKEIPVDVLNGAPSQFTIEDHRFDDGDVVKFSTAGTLPSPLNTTSLYYIKTPTDDTFNISTSSGGASITTSGGTGQHSVIAQNLANVKCVVADNHLVSIDVSDIWLLRSDSYYKIHLSDIPVVASQNNYFEILQNSGNTQIEGKNYTFEDSDKFAVKVVGESLGFLGLYISNPVEQARALILEYSDIVVGDFNANWDTFRDKSTPAQSAISAIKSRIYVDEEKNLLEYSLSLLEQVRLEYAISRNLDIKINAMHFEEWGYNPDFRVRNWDVEEGSTRVTIDDKNNFNRAGGFFDFNPFLEETTKSTGIYKNQDSIDQLAGKQISKQIEFPNLYIESQVTYQLTEILKLASGEYELIDLNLTSRATLLDLGDFVKMDVRIGSIVWEDVPMMIRSIGYDSKMRMPVKLWSMQMIPFANPGGWNPEYQGIVGGDTSTIIAE